MRPDPRLLRRLGTVLFAAVLIASPATAPAATAPQPPTSAATVRAAAGWHTVTLITGDRVRVSADQSQVIVQPARGRERMPASIRRIDGHLHVVPADAAQLVGSGRLDPRLFDLTTLIRSGYDDSRRTDLPLIVSGGKTRGAGMRATRTLGAVGGHAVRAEKASLGRNWPAVNPAKAGGTIWLDGVRTLSLDHSVPQIGAPAAWKSGYTGTGSTVAVIDTGIDGTHPDLAGQVVAAKNFTAGPAGDRVGHGTHVASTVAGTGKASDGRYRGVAPDAKLLDAQVCDFSGCPESAILAAMQWATVEMKADVVNMSLGGPDTPATDPLEAAVEALTARTGALFVTAAGNSGPFQRSVGSPASAPSALAVGAVDRNDDLAEFSSRGPRVGDDGLKPEITAPGVEITAARNRSTPDRRYVAASGTSMASPHVAGAAALLVQRHPDWAPGRLKAALMASAKPNPSLSVFEQGAGRVDVAKAIDRSVFSEPGTVSFGIQRWPHHDDTPVSRQVSFHNAGPAPVTLDLRATLTDRRGRPAPGGAIKLSATSITVPAGGSAAVTLTADTRHRGPDGAYTGRLIATADSQQIATTPLHVDKEVESYDLTVRTVDRTGRPTPGSTVIVGRGVLQAPYDEDGVTVLRLPKGRYLLDSQIWELDPDRGRIYWMVQPSIELSGDRTVVADARTTRPMSVTAADKPSARVMFAHLGLVQPRGHGVPPYVSATWNGDLDSFFTAQLGPAAKGSGLISFLQNHLGEPTPDGIYGFENTPYAYSLSDTIRDRFFTGYDKTVRDRDLATVVHRFSTDWQHTGQVDEGIGYHPFPAGVPITTTGGWPYTKRPTSVIQHVTPGNGVRWQTSMGGYFFGTDLQSQPRSYRVGRQYEEVWRGAVSGPAVADLDPAATGVAFGARHAKRFSDRISVSLSLHADGSDHSSFFWAPWPPSPVTAHTSLFRNGSLVASGPEAGVLATDVPAGTAAYELRSFADRSGSSDFATSVSASWRFRSGTTGPRDAVLPLWAVRFTPRVDGANAVPRSPVTMLPVAVGHAPGGPAGRLRRLTVQVSGDDGKTWTSARLVRRDGGFLAIVPTPVGASYVSLRATATDSRGNSVDQTIVRAYRLK